MRLLAAIALCIFSLSASAGMTSIVLYGPEPRSSEAYEYNQMQWGWYGAYSTHTEWVRFDLMGPVQKARLFWVVWPYDRCYIALEHHDDGPVNVVKIAQMTHPNSNQPKVLAEDITSDINSLINAGTAKHLRFRLHGHCVVSTVKVQWWD